MGLAPRRQGHHQQLGSVQHALHLELHEIFLALAQGLGGEHALLLHQRVDAFAQRALPHADEAPRLHEAHAGRMVGGAQQAQQHLVTDRAAGKVAHVAPLVDGAVDGRPLAVRERGGGNRAVVVEVVGVVHAAIVSLRCRAAQGPPPGRRA